MLSIALLGHAYSASKASLVPACLPPHFFLPVFSFTTSSTYLIPFPLYMDGGLRARMLAAACVTCTSSVGLGSPHAHKQPLSYPPALSLVCVWSLNSHHLLFLEYFQHT